MRQSADPDLRQNNHNLALNPDQQTAATSGHYYDKNNPSSPNCLAQSLDIDQIDKVRVTTKVKGLTGSKYTFKDFPVKVAWQSSSGIGKSGGLPPINVFQGANDLFSLSMLDVLDELNLQLEGTDDENADIKNFGDLAQVAGSSLMTQFLNSPNGSLKGWDASSLLETLGKAYLAQELGLVPGALSDTSGDIVKNIGRSSVEYLFGFPRGSLIGGDPAELYSSIGRRYMEERILKVTPGTLVPSPGFPITNSTQLSQRIGEGRFERVFSMPPQSLRKQNLTDIRSSSLKAKLTFKPENSQEIDDRLYLAFVAGSDASPDTDSGKNSRTDLDTPTAAMMSKGDAASLQKYFKIIGDRQLASTLGAYSDRTNSPLTLECRVKDNDGIPFSVPINNQGKCDATAYKLDPKADPGSKERVDKAEKDFGGPTCASYIVISQFYDSNLLDPCNPKTILSTFNDSVRSDLVASGVLTNQEAQKIKGDLENAISSKTYALNDENLRKQYQADISTLNTRLRTIYNDITNGSSGWKTIFDKAQAKLELTIKEKQKSGPITESDPRRLLQSQHDLERINEQFKTFQDAILAVYKNQG